MKIPLTVNHRAPTCIDVQLASSAGQQTNPPPQSPVNPRDSQSHTLLIDSELLMFPSVYALNTYLS